MNGLAWENFFGAYCFDEGISVDPEMIRIMCDEMDGIQRLVRFETPVVDSFIKNLTPKQKASIEEWIEAAQSLVDSEEW